jgi:hypothetical protein
VTGERTWVAETDTGAPTMRLRALDPGGRSAADIKKSWTDGTLELDPDAMGSWYFSTDPVFHGRTGARRVDSDGGGGTAIWG